MTTIGFKALGMALLFSTAAFAQDTDIEDATKRTKSKYTSLGPVVGIGHTWVSNSNNTNNFKPAVQLGVGILYSRYEHWGFGGTLTASHEGFSRDIITPFGTYVNTYDPTYLRLTPRAYYFFGDYKDNIRPKVFLGPSVAVKLIEDQYVRQPNQPTESVPVISTTEMYNTLDFGVNAGAGVNIKIAKYTWLNLDADYYHGLLNVTNFNNQNRSLRANVGVMIGI